jgi:ribosome-interacting GTPase 1
MAANLSPDYLEAERDYKSAATQAEKIAALERMLSTIPKHKGTEKLQADIKRKLSQARKDGQKKGGAAHAAPFYQIEREGAGQVALVGPPDSGKSQMLATLTRARPEVADYPFTTRFPTPGMMQFENVQVQLVDLPPVSAEFMEPWLPQAIRHATAAVLVVDASDPAILDEIDFILSTLGQARIAEPALVAANKIDLPGAEDNAAALDDLYRGRFRFVGVSALTGRNLDVFARAAFDILEIVRVYTKVPGKPAEFTTPFIMKRGGTVQDAARMVHKDFAEQLKYARLFRREGDRNGLMVERSHVVADEDILEFHI